MGVAFLDVDVPLGFFGQAVEQAVEGGFIEFGGKCQIFFSEGLPQCVDEPTAKQGADNPEGEQVAIVDRNPFALVIDSAAGDQAVQVWMATEVAAPGVEAGEDAGFGTEVFFIVQQFGQSGGCCLKQQLGHNPVIGPPQGVELMRQCEDDVVVVAVQ